MPNRKWKAMEKQKQNATNDAHLVELELRLDGFVFAGETGAVSVPRILWHVTNAAGMWGILDQKAMWARSSDHTNDRSELKYSHSLVAEEMENLFDETGLGIFEEFIAQYEKQTFADIWDAYIASFCQVTDDVSTWRTYGRDGKGMAIGFDPVFPVTRRDGVPYVDLKLPVQRDWLEQNLSWPTLRGERRFP